MPGKPLEPARRPTPERKAEAITLCQVEGLPVVEVAKRLGLSRSSLNRWLRDARKEANEAERIKAQVEQLHAAIEAAAAQHSALEAQLSILRTEAELLSHELSLALAGGALNAKPIAKKRKGAADSGERWQPLSHSQLGQDLWVLEQLGWKRSGYFVEFGATDGVLLSNSWLLEKHFGWEGICAEPNPKLFERLQQNRSCTLSPACVYRSSGERMRFVLADAYGGLAELGTEDQHGPKRDAYAAAGEVIEVTTTSLMDLLAQHGAPPLIDYLSIDTEGSELAILEGLDWDRYQFRCITVEHNFTAQRQGLQTLLEARGYQRQEAQWDDWYVLMDE
ncbi:FkbM family methyltransferase [Synechococcus sp. MW101C3]|uniref:FkbM family methyltransferase n=1 Tax=Synechococcus sp. MW101C3 TaxID=210768 RepID=UPI000B99470E|nr:FkbM family methyltransferase [Synechococcus sp. MW101C3]